MPHKGSKSRQPPPQTDTGKRSVSTNLFDIDKFFEKVGISPSAGTFTCMVDDYEKMEGEMYRAVLPDSKNYSFNGSQINDDKKEWEKAIRDDKVEQNIVIHHNYQYLAMAAAAPEDNTVNKAFRGAHVVSYAGILEQIANTVFHPGPAKNFVHMKPRAGDFTLKAAKFGGVVFLCHGERVERNPLNMFDSSAEVEEQNAVKLKDEKFSSATYDGWNLSTAIFPDQQDADTSLIVDVDTFEIKTTRPICLFGIALKGKVGEQIKPSVKITRIDEDKVTLKEVEADQIHANSSVEGKVQLYFKKPIFIKASSKHFIDIYINGPHEVTKDDVTFKVYSNQSVKKAKVSELYFEKRSSKNYRLVRSDLEGKILNSNKPLKLQIVTIAETDLYDERGEPVELKTGSIDYGDSNAIMHKCCGQFLKMELSGLPKIKMAGTGYTLDQVKSKAIEVGGERAGTTYAQRKKFLMKVLEEVCALLKDVGDYCTIVFKGVYDPVKQKAERTSGEFTITRAAEKVDKNAVVKEFIGRFNIDPSAFRQPA